MDRCIHHLPVGHELDTCGLHKGRNTIRTQAINTTETTKAECVPTDLLSANDSHLNVGSSIRLFYHQPAFNHKTVPRCSGCLMWWLVPVHTTKSKCLGMHKILHAPPVNNSTLSLQDLLMETKALSLLAWCLRCTLLLSGWSLVALSVRLVGWLQIRARCECRHPQGEPLKDQISSAGESVLKTGNTTTTDDMYSMSGRFEALICTGEISALRQCLFGSELSWCVTCESDNAEKLQEGRYLLFKSKKVNTYEEFAMVHT